MVHPGDEDKKQVPVAEVKPDSRCGNIPRDSSRNDDVVTLTKSQLRAIFEAIGQVGNLSITDKPANSGRHCNDEVSEKKKANVSPSRISVPEANGSSESSASQSLCPLDLLLPSSSKVSSTSEPQKQSQQQQVQLSGTSQQEMSPSKSSLSRLEQKRLQWEKEKAEMHEWNPWGKPGAGAPTRKSVPIASVAPRTDSQLLNVQPVPYSSSVPNNLSSCLTSPVHTKGIPNTSDQSNQASPFHHNKPYMSYNCVTQPIKPVPPVFKSSIAFGPNDDESVSDDILNKKQQWLRELEVQRDEQRIQRLIDQDPYQVAASEADWNMGSKNDLDSISVSFEGGNSAPYTACQADGRSYVRGQGFKLDPVSAAKAEERRQKAQEYQLAIRMQMEEKQRRLQEEKERKKREEEEEEKRLAAERAQMQAEYEQEQRRLKQKMEMEEKKQNAMLSAVREAQAQAEACKKSKKAQKLQQAQSATTNNESGNKSASSSLSPQKANVVSSPIAQHKSEEPKRWSEDNASTKPHQTVHPLQSSNDETKLKSPSRSEISYCKEIGIQTIPASALHSEEFSGYTTNRILTPASHRVRARRNHAKDFGTQTDINYGKWIGDDAESTDQSNTSSVRPPVNKRLTRVQHSKPYKASRHQFGGDMSSLIDRPKWGVNQPSKSYIRMTDRDPHFSKRKKLQELRKQHWEREMATQQALRNARKNNVPSYPPLRSRRIRSSSEGTAGFSSSEFETRNVRRVPRRFQENYEFCSMCGSAEDIDYLRNSPTYSSSHLPSMRQRRESQSSDNLPSIIGGSEPAPSRLTERFSFPEVSVASSTLPPVRRKWHSQEAFCPHGIVHGGESSPPVPALHHRHLLPERSPNSLSSPPVHSRRKWSDQESFDLESVALSHSKSRRSPSEDSSDKNEKESLSSAGSSRRGKTPTEQNPLVCPEVVTGRPTPRQDRILQNLSSLRQGLLQKKKDIETLLCQQPSHS